MTQRPDEEEEEQDLAAATRRAWYAGRQSAGEPLESSGFRAVPGVPHGGSKTVTPEQTAGSMDWCWCGLPFDHDWPGKDAGRKHPRKEPEVTSTSTEEQPRIERRALRAYHADLADIILTAVNEYGTKYRLTAHSVILFPLDGTKPYAINARNGDRQVRGARMWFAKHAVPPDISIKEAAKKPAPSTKPVDETVVKELAEMLNSEEHQPPADQPQHGEATADPPQQPAPAKKATMVATKKSAHPAPPEPAAEAPAEEPAATEPVVEPTSPDDWVPYYTGKSKGKNAEGKRHAFYVTNGVDVKCTIDGWIGKPTGTGGHTRTHHTDTTTLWGPKAKEKGVQTYFTNKAIGQVAEGIALIQNALEITPPAADTSAQDAEIKELKAKNQALTTERDELKSKLADLEAKQALLRETLGL